MKYPIGKVAKTFGFTKEALRFYERAGILIPERDENGYRYYKKTQLQRVALIKQLQNIGLSLKEISRLLTRCSEKHFFSILEHCAHARERELRYQQALLEKLKEDLARYRAEPLYECPKIVRLPEHYAFYFDDVEKLVNDEKIRPDILRWYNRMYPALGLETVAYDDIEHRPDRRRIGLLADRHSAVASGLPQTGNIEVLPACRAVEFSLRAHREERFFRRIYDLLRRAEEVYAVRYQGPVHMIVNFGYMEEDGYMSYISRIYAPIREE